MKAINEKREEKSIVMKDKLKEKQERLKELEKKNNKERKLLIKKLERMQAKKNELDHLKEEKLMKIRSLRESKFERMRARRAGADAVRVLPADAVGNCHVGALCGGTVFACRIVVKRCAEGGERNRCRAHQR